MKNKKSRLQKSATYLAVASFLISVGSPIYLFNVDVLGLGSPISASLFFCICGLCAYRCWNYKYPQLKLSNR